MWELKLTKEEIRNQASRILHDLLISSDEPNFKTQFEKIHELTRKY